MLERHGKYFNFAVRSAQALRFSAKLTDLVLNACASNRQSAMKYERNNSIHFAEMFVLDILNLQVLYDSTNCKGTVMG